MRNCGISKLVCENICSENAKYVTVTLFSDSLFGSWLQTLLVTVPIFHDHSLIWGLVPSSTASSPSLITIVQTTGC